MALEFDRIVGFEEDISNGIRAKFREGEAAVNVDLALEKLVRDTGHDSCAVTVATVCTSGTAVRHGAEEMPRVGDDFVAWDAFNLAQETDTTRVTVVGIVVEALTGGGGACPRVGIAEDGVEGGVAAGEIACLVVELRLGGREELGVR